MITDTSHILLPDIATDTLSAAIDVDIKKYFKLDRYLGDVLTLPYKFEDVKIKSNELCVSDNINASLYKLYHNFLYLNAQTRVASNKFPTVYSGYMASIPASIPNTTLVWYDSTLPSTSAADALNTTGTILSGIVDGTFTDSLDVSDTYVGFVANSNTVIPIQSNNNKASFRLGNNINDAAGWKTLETATALSFSNIKSVAVNSDNNLFVCDDTAIYKLDIDSLLTHNAAISGVGRFLLKSIGGISEDIYDKIKFGNPVSMRIGNNDTVYILDAKDKGYKIYDKNLNWVSTAVKKTDFTSLSSNLVDMAVSTQDSHVYILTSDGIIFEYSDDHTLVKKHILRDILTSTEQFKRLVFSKIDTNILYVLTTSNLYKKFKTKLSRSIGAFRLSDINIQAEYFNFIDVYKPAGSAYEYVFVGSTSVTDQSIGKVFKFEEKTIHQTILYDTYKTQTYSLSSINVKGDEYVSSWVINKSMHKLLYNHLIMKDHFHSKYVGKYDDVGRIQYDDVQYIMDSDPNLFEYSIPANCTIGINEPMLASTINRPLNEIYKAQQTLLSMCMEKYSNKYPPANKVVVL
jgi:hypothetical protein